MNTTVLPQKANNVTHFNGFPNLSLVPETLHDLLLFIRKQNPKIQLEFKPLENGFYIAIKFPLAFTIKCMDLMNQVPAKHYKIAKFSHKEYVSSLLILKTL